MTATSESSGTGLVFLISAPSGGGKTTVCQRLLATMEGLSRVVTCTTRAPRQGERDGVDYHFLDRATFRKRVAAGEFLEHATVYGQWYGTLKAEVYDTLRRGRDVLLAVDVQGAASIRGLARSEPTLARALVTVFLAPPSLGALADRLRRRGQDAPEVIEARLAVAEQEISQWREFDYLVVSASADEDYRRAQTIYEAEKLRVCRVPHPPAAGGGGSE
jgi:guanylate kinase